MNNQENGGNSRCREKGFEMEQIIASSGLNMTVPQMLNNAVQNNSALRITIEKEGGSLVVNHAPRTSTLRREIFVKLSTDD